jgi:ssDNA-binding Zn-finger/Zn-ribbon topoisomerase 1
METADAEVLAQLAAAMPVEAMEAFLPEEDETAAGRPCPTCGQPLLMKEDRFGSYLACSGFPSCRYAEASRQEEPVMACPLCRQGSIMVKRTAPGRTIYLCREEGCEFLSWSRPHAGPCPACQAPYLVEKKEAGGRTVLGCSRTGCGYRQESEGGERQGRVDAPRKVVKVRVVKRGAAGAAGGKRKVVVVRRKK